MLSWLSANSINIVLIAVIVLVCFFVIRGMLRDKKAGKSSCGGSCAGCAGCGARTGERPVLHIPGEENT